MKLFSKYARTSILPVSFAAASALVSCSTPNHAPDPADARPLPPITQSTAPADIPMRDGMHDGMRDGMRDGMNDGMNNSVNNYNRGKSTSAQPGLLDSTDMQTPAASDRSDVPDMYSDDVTLQKTHSSKMHKRHRRPTVTKPDYTGLDNTAPSVQ